MAWTTMVVSALWVTCLGLLLQAVGFAIPFWFGYETAATAASNDKTLQSYVGSWYVMSCVKGEASSCKSEAVEPELDSTTGNVDIIGLAFLGTTQEIIAKAASLVLARSKWWIAVVIASTCSIGLCLLAGLILICCRCAGIHSKIMFGISAVILLFGACGVLGTTAYSTYLVADKFSFLQDINAARFPWSILLFGLGGLCALGASFLLFVIICAWQRYGEYRASDDDSLLEDDVPMSNMSKSRPERGFDNPKYAYPREQANDFKRGYPDRNGYGDGSRQNDYVKYISRERGYDRYDRDRGYDRYGYDDRSYDRRQAKDRGYERDRDRAYEVHTYERRGPGYERERDYAMSRTDNMYRPYAQRY